MATVLGVVILAALVGAHGAFWLTCHQKSLTNPLSRFAPVSLFFDLPRE
jgi:hypothetical protein